MNNLKPFNLEEYLTNPSKKVVTRDGREVKIHCTNHYLTNQCVIAEIKDIGLSFSFNQYGQQYGNTEDSPLNLFFASEKKEGWINIYKTKQSRYTLGSSIYNSKEEARDAVYNSEEYVTTIKIEWEE